MGKFVTRALFCDNHPLNLSRFYLRKKAHERAYTSELHFLDRLIFLVDGSKTTTMSTITGEKCIIEIVGKSHDDKLDCSVLLANGIILIRTKPCTVKFSIKEYRF